MDEQSKRRTTVRRRTILGGRIITKAGRAINCMVLDISRSGARVRADEAIEINSLVDLKIDRFTERQRSDVIWVKEDSIGLRFLNEITTVPESMEAFFNLLPETTEVPEPSR